VRVHALVATAEQGIAAVEAGATVVQLRLKDVSTARRIEVGRRLRRLPVLLVVNDDIEAALACGADAVHLGQSDAAGSEAIAAGLRVGVSVATPDQARVAEAVGAAYLGAGPVWPTPTKTDAGPSIGLDGLAAICAVVAIPVVAIGGIDAGNAAECIRCGAAGVAVVRSAADPGVRRSVDAALTAAGVPVR
jgi:thiamine-phosphate pyrophosphorylase